MIYYFNPGHETAVKNGSPYYMAPANVAAMRYELSFLPAWYAHDEDVVLVENAVADDFYNTLSEKLKLGAKAVTKDQLVEYKGMEVSLWGISPQGICYFEEIDRRDSLSLTIPKWDDRFVYLNSRESARDILEILINNNSDLSGELLPQFFSSLDAIEDHVSQYPVQLLAKAPYSSSGRGLLWLPVGELTRTERQILHGMLKKQDTVSVERALNKQVDFAMEFYSDGSGDIRFVGYSLFETNKKGAYLGNILYSQSDIEARLGEMIPIYLLGKTKDDLLAILSRKYGFYKGYIGVDMMIYRDEDSYGLHPCVEVNMRANMGVVAINIQQRYVSPLSKGKFYIDFSAKEGEIYTNHLKMKDQLSPQFEDNKLKQGYMSLCPVHPQSHYRAYIVIE